MHFRRVTAGIRVSVTQPSTPASMEYRVAIWSFSIFFNTKNAQKYQHFYLATQMEHDQSSYFCWGPDEFCWGHAPVGPTMVMWAYFRRLIYTHPIFGCFCQIVWHICLFYAKMSTNDSCVWITRLIIFPI